MFSIYSSLEQNKTWSRSISGPVSKSKHLLRGVGHVEEAVLVLVVLVDLCHGEGHAGQPAVVDEQVEGLGGQQGHPVPEDNQNHIKTSNPTNAARARGPDSDPKAAFSGLAPVLTL